MKLIISKIAWQDSQKVNLLDNIRKTIYREKLKKQKKRWLESCPKNIIELK